VFAGPLFAVLATMIAASPALARRLVRSARQVYVASARLGRKLSAETRHFAGFAAAGNSCIKGARQK
jgi:hypothetical protein